MKIETDEGTVLEKTENVAGDLECDNCPRIISKGDEYWWIDQDDNGTVAWCEPCGRQNAVKEAL